jgi:hypothetical protein
VLSTDVTKSKIKKGEFLTIFVTAGSSSLVVTGQYQFKVKAHFKAISVFNLNELGSINFSKMLHFYSQKPECIDVDDIFSYTNFEKTDIMLELRYAIIDKIYSQKHIQIKASDISVEIKTNDIFDLNFSKERFLAIVVSPSLTAEKIIGETTVPIKAKAEYDNKNYLPNISVLANRNIGNYSFFA